MTAALVREITDPPEPGTAALQFIDQPQPVLLESRPGFGRLGEYSFLAADPFLVLRSKNAVIEEIGAEETKRIQGDPFQRLQDLLLRYPTDGLPDLPPFQGGAAGYLGYDLCHHLERLPRPSLDDIDAADLHLGFYDWVIGWDHAADRAWVISTGHPAEGEARHRRALERMERVLGRLAGGAADRWNPRPAVVAPSDEPPGGTSPCSPLRRVPGVTSNFSRRSYERAVQRTIDYIYAGDIFQANLSQRLSATWNRHPFELYRRLRAVNPAPFAAYLDTGGVAVVSASPERFLRLRDRAVETRPIKGTRPRGATPEHDMALDRWLRRSEKDRAENVMIVDLLRNDLSRVCEDDSVRVPELCVAEHFTTVHHLVSTVVGRLRPGLGAVDLLRAAFPGGSVTGAPKVRAMEIIAELEPTCRSVYCGAIGYIGFDGAMDTNIAIRTFILRGGRAYFQVGGAVVSDSDPGQEYEETLDKASGLLAALEPAS